MSDISLTAGMRANLVSLQGTVDLLNRTQTRLSSGKKVNNALDDPISYFTAQSLNSRAANLSSLKDGMSGAVQTINAANNGITAITSLIDSAKAIAQSALSANGNQVKISIGTLSAAMTFGINGSTFGAVASSSTPTSTQFVFTGDASTDAANLSSLINSQSSTINASVSGSTVVLSAKTTSLAITSAGNVVTVGTGMTITTDTAGTQTQVFSDRAALAKTYNNLMLQIDAVANSSGYKGLDLLTNNSLNVAFESSALTVKGFSATASDLGLSTKAATTGGLSDQFAWTLNSDITKDLGKVDTAYATLKSQATSLAANLGVINTQQAFSTSMITTLTQGADQLTLADMNEEGANMLMLQTRQSLGTTALSLSSQAAQSVLRLFA